MDKDAECLLIFDSNLNFFITDVFNFDLVKNKMVFYKKSGSNRDGYFYYKNKPFHRYLLGITDKKIQIDHKDCDTRNNKINNLRIASPMENSRNRRGSSKTGFKGVTKRSHKRYRARITVDKKLITIGHSDTPEGAARLYNEAAKKYFGDFALLNDV